MSEKRFTFYYERGNEVVIEDNGKRLSNKKVVDLLNEQQAIIIDLKEENEQLKIANAKWFDKSLQDKQIRYSNANHKELTKKYLQLKEENEELRKELDNFKPVMFQDVRKGTVILYSKD